MRFDGDRGLGNGEAETEVGGGSIHVHVCDDVTTELRDGLIRRTRAMEREEKERRDARNAMMCRGGSLSSLKEGVSTHCDSPTNCQASCNDRYHPRRYHS